jgi:hypothetical protein
MLPRSRLRRERFRSLMVSGATLLSTQGLNVIPFDFNGVRSRTLCKMSMTLIQCGV